MRFFDRQKELQRRVRDLEVDMQCMRDTLRLVHDRIDSHHLWLKEGSANHRLLLDHFGLHKETTPAKTQLVKKGGPEQS